MTNSGPLMRKPALKSESTTDGQASQNIKLPDHASTEGPAIFSELRRVEAQRAPSVKDPGLKILLTRMDSAFSDYSRESEQLSVLLSKTNDLPGWTSYNALLRQRTAEVVAYEQYRGIQDELFKRIVPPSADDKPDSAYSWLRAKTR